MPRPTKEQVDAVTKLLVDKGKLIEAGWQGYTLMTSPEGASAVQLSETRMAFFAGAQHLFGSIMNMLEAGEEPTANDLNRMTLIATELRQFVKELELRAKVVRNSR